MSPQAAIHITGGRLVTMTEGAVPGEPGDLLIHNGEIVDILPPGSRIDGAETISAEGMIVLPGFVDTHRHTWQTQLRTVAANWTLFDYIVQMRSIYSAFYTPADAYLGNLLGALESINAGITTIVDHCHLINSPEHADSLAGALFESGIRGVFCYGFFVNPKHNPYSLEEGPGWRYQDARRLRAEILASDSGRIRFGIAPQEPEAIPPEILRQEIALARDLGAHQISMHVGMGNYDGGNRIVEGLYKDGLLDGDMLFVHGAALTPAELDAIAEVGAGLSCTPETELQMGMGFPIAFAARERGVRVSLGIDIVSNYAADMFVQMRQQLQSARALDHQALAAQGMAPRRLRHHTRDVLRLATLGGAEALHQENRIGSLERGKAADVILVRADGLHMMPSPDPIAALVFGATPADVDTVIIDGIVRKRHGQLVGVDIDALKGRLCESAVRIGEDFKTVDRAGVEAFWGQIFPNLEKIEA